MISNKLLKTCERITADIDKARIDGISFLAADALFLDCRKVLLAVVKQATADRVAAKTQPLAGSAAPKTPRAKRAAKRQTKEAK